MTVHENELLSIGQQINILARRVKELEADPNRYVSQKVADDLREARARLRSAKRERARLVERGQLSMFGGGV